MLSKSDFWKEFENQLSISIRLGPEQYGSNPENASADAARISGKLRAAGLASCYLDSRSFKATFKLMPGATGQRFGRARMLDLYANLSD